MVEPQGTPPIIKAAVKITCALSNDLTVEDVGQAIMYGVVAHDGAAARQILEHALALYDQEME